MVKKILLSTICVAALAVGGGYYYSVSKFETEAQSVVQQLDDMKAKLKFDEVSIDKFNYSVTFKNLKLTLNEPQTVVEKKDEAKPAAEGTNQPTQPTEQPAEVKSDKVEEPASAPKNLITIDYETTITAKYNPITRTLNVKFLDDGKALRLAAGEQKPTVIKMHSQDPISLSIGFSGAPHFDSKDLLKTLTSISSFKMSSGKVSYVEEGSNAEVFVADGMNTSVQLTIPSDDKQEFSLDVSASQQGVGFGKGLTAFIEPIIKEFSPEIFAEYQKRTPNLDINNKSTGETKFKFSSSFGELKEFAAKLIAKDPTLKMPSVNLLADMDSQNQVGKATYFIKLKNDASLGVADLEVKLNTTLNKDQQTYFIENGFAKAVDNYFESIKQPHSIDEAALKDITAPLFNGNPINFDLKAHGNLSSFQGNAQLNIDVKDYVLDVKVDSSQTTGIKANIEMTDHAKFFDDFGAYVDKVLGHESMKKSFPGLDAQSIKSQVIGVKAMAEAMGKVEEKSGRKVLKIEQTIPALGGGAGGPALAG